jgi:hypothetical protein
LKASNFTANGDNFHNASSAGSSFWRDKGKNVTWGLPYAPLVQPFGMPLIVKPNSAVEVSGAVNGVGNIVGAFFMWDEVERV